MGRKGNRRRWKNSNPAFDHDRLRKEACDSRNQNLKLDEKIQLSEPVRIAESRSRELISNTLYVGNISYNADAVAVVESLAKAAESYIDLDCYDEEDFPILRCVLPNPPEARRAYFAFVTVASKKIKQKLLGLSRIFCCGRDLRIKEAQKYFYHDPAAFRSEIEAVQIGFPIFNVLTRSQQRRYNFMYDNRDHYDELPWEYQWASDKESLATYLEINGLRKLIAFEFSKTSTNYRVELSMHHIEGGVRVEDDTEHNGRRVKVLVLVLKVPPAIFRSEGGTNTQSSGMFAKTSIPLLTKGIQNKLLWQLGSISGQDNKEWVRTVDCLSLNKCTFSRCLVYRVVLQPKSSRHILEYLRKFQLSGERLTKSIPISNSYPSNLNTYVGWSGYSSDKIFERLPFPIKYLIQCLVSQNRMSFADDLLSKSFLEKILENQLLALCAMAEMEKHWHQLFYLEPALNLEVWMKNYIHDHDYIDDIFKRGIYVRTVTITPLCVICHAPQLSHSNRVLREYPELRERLVRVTFADEALGPFFKAKSDDIFELRMRKLLRFGINIAGRTFRFLAYSNSQLRSTSCWMYDETTAEDTNVPTVDDLRKKLGNFDLLKNRPSRFGSRLGQCFSDVLIANAIESSQWKLEDDINRNGFCFSDGVGKISRRLSAKLSTEIGYGYIPSAFQIRFAGFKGVLTQHKMPSDLGNGSIDIIFRRSMKKFESPSQCLEIVATSVNIPAFLNRQIIVLLSDLGVPDEVFLSMQSDMMSELEDMFLDRKSALNYVTSVESNELDSTTNIVADLLQSGFEPQSNLFVSCMLCIFRELSLRDIVNKSRILVKDGVVAIGVVDETNSLKAGEVFIQYQRPNMGLPVILEDEVIVGRNPSLHPGDIRKLKAVNVPSLQHLVNVVVFPSEGNRPLPTMMSGGDLDGDIYFAWWDERLFPKKIAEPMSYTKIGNDITPVQANDIVDWFVKFTENDILGRIADAHLIHSDVQTEGTFSEACLKLSELHSVAVDFAKTGKPASFPKQLTPPLALPDFKQYNLRPSYESRKILGQLFRAAKGKTFTQPDIQMKVDDDLLLPERYLFLEEAMTSKNFYERDLCSIMHQFGILSEAEICSGYISSFYRAHEQNMSKKHAERIVQRVRLSYKILRNEFRDSFWSELDEYFITQKVDTLHHELLTWAKASAWYASIFEHPGEEVPYDEEYQRLMSFGFIMHELLCEIKQKALA